jgi:hypothetical protein
MSNPSRPVRGISLRLLALSVIAAVAAFGAGAATASADPISLTWNQYKVYDSPYVVPNTCRTWLGYVSRHDAPGAANGSAWPSNGTTGPVLIDGTTPFSCSNSYDWSFPATSGSLSGTALNPSTLAGTLSFKGTFTYDSPAPPTGHGFHIEITNPKLVLSGTGTGELRASGINNADPAYTAYSDLKVFDINASAATYRMNFDGSASIDGLAPAVAATNFFTAAYPLGAGPNRAPNTFGTFSITIPANAGPKGDAGQPGASGKDAVVTTRRTFIMKSRVFPTNKTVIARVTKNKRYVGYATVTGRRVQITAVVKDLKGSHTLTPVTRKIKPVTVKLG